MIKILGISALLTAFLLAGCAKAPEVYKLPKVDTTSNSGGTSSSSSSSYEEEDD